MNKVRMNNNGHKFDETGAHSNLEVTVFSPVNVQVYLNDRSHLLMCIDHNSGFDYRFQNIPAQENFTLIFEAKGFVKEIPFHPDGTDRIEFHLGSILTEKEIRQSYDQKEAREYLERNNPTSYTFESLGAVGTREDLESIAKWLSQWNIENVEDSSFNYLIARACDAIAKLAIQYRDGSYVNFLDDIYMAYQAKKSYGYIIECAQKKLYSVFKV